MVGKRRNDWDEIIADYQSGDSLSCLHKKYGVSPYSVRRKLKQLDIVPHGFGYGKIKKWVKLISAVSAKKKNNSSVIVSLAGCHLEKAGVPLDGPQLYGKWSVLSENKLMLEIRCKGE